MVFQIILFIITFLIIFFFIVDQRIKLFLILLFLKNILFFENTAACEGVITIPSNPTLIGLCVALVFTYRNYHSNDNLNIINSSASSLDNDLDKSIDLSAGKIITENDSPREYININLLPPTPDGISNLSCETSLIDGFWIVYDTILI